MISHQKFVGLQEDEAGVEVQGTEQFGPFKVCRCHLAACWDNWEWRWTVKSEER